MKPATLRRWWGVVTLLIVAAICLQAVFAGVMLGGVGWARVAHRATAAILIASTTIAGLTALVALRKTPHGLKLGLTLLSLAVAVVLQAALGALSAKGANLLSIHVPLGVALVGLAALAAAGARRLGEDERG